MAMASEAFLASCCSLFQGRCMMSPMVSPGFSSSGPKEAHIPASLVIRCAMRLERAFTQILTATARGRGSVTSTPVMLSPARVSAPFLAR
eukprot:6150590-Heterocapsa_arctica.AAC.1